MMNRIKDVETIQAANRAADGDLLARFVKRRDDSAFAELVARHGRMVFGVCLRRLGQSADAEDAFQAVFLTLARHAEGLALRTTVGPWLYTVVRQVTTKALRSRRRRRWLPWASAPEPQAMEPAGVDVDLDAALATLSEQERSAIVLCHLEGLSRSEAAKALGCPEGTLSARLSRGLEKLRQKLGKPPLAVLVAASLVMLPDELPASTVDLVHHLRSGTLDDWASPGTLDLYRKADPMRWLNRAGPVVASFAAVGLIMVGVSFGWNLIQAQQDKPGKEKSKVVDERARGQATGEGVGPLVGGSGSNDPVGSGGGSSLGQGSSSGAGRAIGGDSGGGRGSLGPATTTGGGFSGEGLSGAALSGGGRGGGGFGGDEGGAAGVQGKGGPGGRGAMRGMKSGGGGDGALFGGGGGRFGMMDRGTMGGSIIGTADGVTLAEAVQRFNAFAKTKEIGKTQPPLTEDEVIAAIRGWRGEAQGTGSDELYKAFQNVADTKTLPRAWSLDSAESWRFNNYNFDVWRIEMSISIGRNMGQITVRDQKIRVRPTAATAKTNRATDSALITIPLKNSNADSVAELIGKAIEGKWLETKVTADSRTNSLIILAPKSKEESIRKTVQALDDLQK